MGEFARPSGAFSDDQLLQAIACVVDGKAATYVSGPITTGSQFLAWYVHTGFRLEHGGPAYRDGLRREVVSVNQARIDDVARKLRSSGRIVIEPATLEVKEWGQTEYVSFWLKVIDAFACEIVVVPEWQYSLGCCAEFRHAIRSGIPVRDGLGELISERVGMRMILEAASDIRTHFYNFEFLLNVAEKLERFADQV